MVRFVQGSLFDSSVAIPPHGPSAGRLHLLDGLDGSYLRCEKRLVDAGAMDRVWCEDSILMMG